MPWHSVDATPGADPYLEWAEATDWRDFKRAGQAAPTWLTVVLELRTGKTPSALQRELGRDVRIAPAYLGMNTRFCTAQLRQTSWRQLAAPSHPIVKRFELALPVLPQRTTGRPAAAATTATAEAQRDSAGATSTGEVLLAVIDAGCPFAHAGFQHRGQPRVLRLWDQDHQPAFGTATAPGCVPANFGYGREMNRSGFQSLMNAARYAGQVDEDTCYGLANYPALRRAATHGAHVMDQFIGPRRLGDRIALQAGVPPTRRQGGPRASDTADLVFVQLPRDAWADPNGLALPACVLDGLHYILSCRGASTRRVVVNISCTIHTGAHNGSSILDAALAEFVSSLAEAGCELEIVMPAGNTHSAQLQASGTVTEGSLTLRVPPGSESPTFMQLWVQAPGESLSVTLKAPQQTQARAIDEPLLLLRDAQRVLAMALCSHSTARGDGAGSLWLLAVAAADLPDQAGPAGDWALSLSVRTVSGAQPQPVLVRAFVARNESTLGAPLRHRPARLIDPAYDPDRYLREREEDPPPALTAAGLHVRREGTVADAAMGTAPFVVAGVVQGPKVQPARYSGSGVRAKACAAVTDESRALPGIPGAGTRSGSVVRLQGTSFGAPQVARILADRPLPAKPGARDPGGPQTSEFVTLPFANPGRVGQALALPQQVPPAAPP